MFRRKLKELLRSVVMEIVNETIEERGKANLARARARAGLSDVESLNGAVEVANTDPVK